MGSILAFLAVFTVNTGNIADHRVFVTKNKNEAHLWVYATNRRFDSPQREEIWFHTKIKTESDFTIRWVKSRQQADLIIYFVKNRNLAQWRRNHRLKNFLNPLK